TINYTIDSSSSNNPPTLSVHQPDGVDDTVTVGDLYNIAYDLADPDDVVTVAFFYDTDNLGLDGTAIATLTAEPEDTGVSSAWDTTGVTPGTYYIYGITNDGTNPDVIDYSPGQITIEPDGTKQILSIQPLDLDATMRGGNNSGTNYGSSSIVRVKDAGSNYLRRGVFQHDFSELPDNAVIESAAFEVYYSGVLSNDPVGETVDVVRCT
ncbi:MAG: hypothetical protein GY779_18025, partial [Gammaproteobacteria bacterium]|nr:hypothetical protein [Gammaproteobacteria bacterium]